MCTLGSNTRLGPYFRILSFSTAVFCYIQLASSTVVPVVHWDALEKLKVTCSVHLSAILSETNPMCLFMQSLQATVVRANARMAVVVSVLDRPTPLPLFFR